MLFSRKVIIIIIIIIIINFTQIVTGVVTSRLNSP